MSPATKFYRRHRHSLVQFLKFGLIGGSGVLVNLAGVVLIRKLVQGGFGHHEDDPLVNLLGSQFHVRWYHLIVTLAFLLANVWNFQLNRTFTFKSAQHARWFREFIPFFLVGLMSFGLGLLIITALMNPTSPVALPRSVLDGSSGLRTPLYWATLIQIAVTTPLNFVFSKLWAFKAMSSKNVAKRAAEAEAVTQPESIATASSSSKPPCAD